MRAVACTYIHSSPVCQSEARWALFKPQASGGEFLERRLVLHDLAIQEPPHLLGIWAMTATLVMTKEGLSTGMLAAMVLRSDDLTNPLQSSGYPLFDIFR